MHLETFFLILVVGAMSACYAILVLITHAKERRLSIKGKLYSENLLVEYTKIMECRDDNQSVRLLQWREEVFKFVAEGLPDDKFRVKELGEQMIQTIESHYSQGKR